MARMDCNYAYEAAAKAHPEWFEREEDGSLRPHGESTWLFKTCMFSPYFSEQMPAIFREINRRYRADGFFTNGWPGAGALTVCYCTPAATSIGPRSGAFLPWIPTRRVSSTASTTSSSMDRVIEVWKQWDAVAKEGRPDSVYVDNLGGGIHTVKDMWRIGQTAGWFNADHQGRSGNTPIWDCRCRGAAAAIMKGRTATSFNRCAGRVPGQGSIEGGSCYAISHGRPCSSNRTISPSRSAALSPTCATNRATVGYCAVASFRLRESSVTRAPSLTASVR